MVPLVAVVVVFLSVVDGVVIVVAADVAVTLVVVSWL